jgi:hypothetical protein
MGVTRMQKEGRNIRDGVVLEQDQHTVHPRPDVFLPPG